MYLKAIEIQGFKSFPDKTVLTFGSDFTAIVGPNGSGKSNISDAIRWVMGEMSTKALRGSKMEDVIFGGTLKRAQVSFAEVSLILDNSEHTFDHDGTEIMVTRRFYRSGESEYYINRQSARLKDINEMFMDTGLGREGYSNIGQGRIDEILSAKATDRREIFEEAAGISKYRHRKEETERKLQQTRDNLLRINDKISELELQVNPLREQAEKAKKYLVFGSISWKSFLKLQKRQRRTLPLRSFCWNRVRRTWMRFMKARKSWRLSLEKWMSRRKRSAKRSPLWTVGPQRKTARPPYWKPDVRAMRRISEGFSRK